MAVPTEMTVTIAAVSMAVPTVTVTVTAMPVATVSDVPIPTMAVARVPIPAMSITCVAVASMTVVGRVTDHMAVSAAMNAPVLSRGISSGAQRQSNSTTKCEQQPFHGSSSRGVSWSAPEQEAS